MVLASEARRRGGKLGGGELNAYGLNRPPPPTATPMPWGMNSVVKPVEQTSWGRTVKQPEWPPVQTPALGVQLAWPLLDRGMGCGQQGAREESGGWGNAMRFESPAESQMRGRSRARSPNTSSWDLVEARRCVGDTFKAIEEC